MVRSVPPLCSRRVSGASADPSTSRCQLSSVASSPSLRTRLRTKHSLRARSDSRPSCPGDVAGPPLGGDGVRLAQGDSRGGTSPHPPASAARRGESGAAISRSTPRSLFRRLVHAMPTIAGSLRLHHTGACLGTPALCRSRRRCRRAPRDFRRRRGQRHHGRPRPEGEEPYVRSLPTVAGKGVLPSRHTARLRRRRRRSHNRSWRQKASAVFHDGRRHRRSAETIPERTACDRGSMSTPCPQLVHNGARWSRTERGNDRAMNEPP